MAQVFALDPIIQRVLERPVELNSGQILVSVAPPSSQGLLRSFFQRGKLRYYVVTPATRAENVVEATTPVILVKDFARRMTFPLLVEYETSCPVGSAEQVAKALSVEDTPQRALEKYVETIVHEYGASNLKSFGEDIKALLSRLSRFIEQEIYKRTGLDFHARVQVQHHDKLRPHQISGLAIAVHTRDSTQEFILRLSAILDIVGDGYEAALKFPELYGINDRIIKSVEVFCRNELTTQDLFMNVDTEPEIHSKFKTCINTAVKNDGRYVAQLQVKFGKEGFDFEPFRSLKFEIPRTPHLSKDNISIRNDLQLELTDAGIYFAMGKPKLDDWAQQTLESLFERELFGWTYLDFLLKFPQLRTKIKEAMEKEAMRIGYCVRYLITEPDLKENRLLRRDTYPFEYQNLPTAEPDVPVNLQVTTVFRIEELKALEDLLNRNLDVVDAIRDSVRRLLVRLLHRSDPETVYMRFNLDGGEDGRSLQEELEIQISSHLKEEYKAIVESVKVVPLDTAIKRHFEKLVNKLTEFKLEIVPRDQSVPVLLKGIMNVVRPHPNGWLQLRRCNFELEDIINFIKDTLVTELSTYPGDALICLTPQHREELEGLTNKLIQTPVVRQFGIIVLIQNFGSLPIESDVQRTKLQEEKRLKLLQDDRENFETILHHKKQKRQAVQHISEHVHDQLEKLTEAILKLTDSTDPTDIKEREELIRQRDQLTSSLPNLDQLDLDQEQNRHASPSAGLEKLRNARKSHTRKLLYDPDRDSLLFPKQ